MANQPRKKIFALRAPLQKKMSYSVWLPVFLELNVMTLLRCSRVCNSFRRWLINNESIWPVTQRGNLNFIQFFINIVRYMRARQRRAWCLRLDEAPNSLLHWLFPYSIITDRDLEKLQATFYFPTGSAL